MEVKKIRLKQSLFALKEQSDVARDKLLTTFSIFPKDYEITFEACFTSFNPGSLWSNLVNFNTGNSDESSYRVIGLWIFSNGDVLFSLSYGNYAYNGVIFTLSLGCNQYSISQKIFQGYSFTLKIGGVNVFIQQFNGAKEFNNVKMYFSDPWHSAQPGYTKNILVTKSCSELFTVVEKRIIKFNNLLQTIEVLTKEYEIAFEACLTSFISGNSRCGGSAMVFYFTNTGSASCVLNMGFSRYGEMKWSISINNSFYLFTSKPFEIGCKQYRISQLLYQESYMFSIQVDGWTLLTLKNIAPQEFNNVQVYNSDPWCAVQPGYISNLFVTNGCSDIFSLREEYIIHNNLFKTVAIFPKEYEMTFELCLTSFTSGNSWSASSNLFYFTNNGYDSCVICMWFTPKGEMEISATINNTQHGLTTKPFELGCKQYKISQTLYHGYYIFSVIVDEIILLRVKNIAPQDFISVQLYISNPWSLAQPGLIRNLIIKRGCTECNRFYKPLLNVMYDGVIHGNVMDINFVLNYNDPIQSAVKVTWEYFIPPFLILQSEYLSVGVVKIDSNNLKYKNFNLTYAGIKQNISVTINNKRCLFGGSYTIDIPMKLYFANDEDRTWESWKTISKYFNENCTNNIVQTDPNRIPEYYGQGIYWDDAISQLYLCINQYVTSMQKPACFISKDNGMLWKAMDLRIGAILGHHTLTKELYAIHRNQKMYLMFHKIYKKWLAVTNHEFQTNVSSELNWTLLKTMKDNIDQSVTYGINQWMINGDGLYFRKLDETIWIQRIKWSF